MSDGSELRLEDNRGRLRSAIVDAAVEWHQWAWAHPDSTEGAAARDTVLYRVVGEYIGARCGG
jgi:accessory colonization factor AcfC